jgi:hypothetical protein
MKLWHHKFSEGQEQNDEQNESFQFTDKSNKRYFFHQFIIWMMIVSIAVLVVDFFKTNTNFN